MKKVFLTVVLALALAVNYSFAQMGGGMMGGHGGTEGTKGHMQKTGEEVGMMAPDRTQTQKEMKEMADQMSKMMQRISGKMKDAKPNEMKEMSNMMQGMSKQMQDMSMAMGEGWGKIHDMEKMKKEMIRMQQRMDEMEGK